MWARPVLFGVFFFELFVLGIFMGVVYSMRMSNSILVPILIGIQSLHYYIPMAGLASLMDPLNKFAVLGAHVSYILALFLDIIALVLVLSFHKVFEGEVITFLEIIAISAVSIDGVVLILMVIYHSSVVKNIRADIRAKLRDADGYYQADQKFFLPDKKVFRLRRLIARGWVTALIFFACFCLFFLLTSFLRLTAPVALLPSVAFLWGWSAINVVVGPGGKGSDPEPYIKDGYSGEMMLAKIVQWAGVVGLVASAVWIFFSFVEKVNFTYGVLFTPTFVKTNFLTKVFLVTTYVFLALTLANQFANIGLLDSLSVALENQRLRRHKEKPQ